MAAGLTAALPLGQAADCCCTELRRRRRRFRIRFFTDEEEAELLAAADAYNRDTGRECGDFFKTLRLPGNPEGLLAGRPTLLTKVAGLNSLDALSAATTICARVTPVLGRFEVRIVDVSGFGFPRPTLGRFRSLEAARRVATEWQQKIPSFQLDVATVVDIELGQRL